ncbi:MAG TPA: tRNA glutamyl-Q(34) synthetase GluQRS [Methylomirabilota bacterium]|nr:tRNA glutamyl-Q(34) synthetase GluQRS [Methylomirabilota bacterium]
MAYRGRIAPSPTGYMHLGHARTFWAAQERARANGGKLVLRIEDLDFARCRPEFVQAIMEDLSWLGLAWDEGPDLGGMFAPYTQSERLDRYRAAFDILRGRGVVYPCTCSRQDVLRALSAPHQGEEEPVYPGTCRSKNLSSPEITALSAKTKVSWRFRVPDRAPIAFQDLCFGPQSYEAGRHFGDFIVWRHDGIPSYQLAVVVDDHAMQITEVVRGADLLMSTARQILLYNALGYSIPQFYHCPLMTDENGARLAKRHDALSLRQLRASGLSPEEVRRMFASPRTPAEQGT